MSETAKLKLELAFVEAQFKCTHDAAWLLASFIAEKNPHLIDDLSKYVASYQRVYNEHKQLQAYWYMTFELDEIFKACAEHTDANLDSISRLAEKSQKLMDGFTEM